MKFDHLVAIWLDSNVSCETLIGLKYPASRQQTQG